MSSSTDKPAGTRVRASEAAIKATLKAMRESGIPIGRVCISGGQVEIHPGQVEGAPVDDKDDGLEKW